MPWIPSAGAPLGTPQFSGAHLFSDDDTVVIEDVQVPIAMANAVYDTDSYWSALSPERLTAPSGGYYHVGAMLNPDPASDTTFLQSALRLNGDDLLSRFTQQMTNASYAVDHRVLTVDWPMNAGDYVELTCAQNNVSLSSIDCGGQIWIHRISGGTQGIQGPPGEAPIVTEVLDYVERTSFASITATTDDGANTVLTSNTLTFDGSTRIRLTFFCAEINHGSDDGTTYGSVTTWLFEDGTRRTRLGFVRGADVTVASDPIADATGITPAHYVFIFTPSAGDHSYSVRGTVTADNDDGDSGYEAGSGASNARVPCFLLIETLP